jgi:hypothetical protein
MPIRMWHVNQCLALEARAIECLIPCSALPSHWDKPGADFEVLLLAQQIGKVRRVSRGFPLA